MEATIEKPMTMKKAAEQILAENGGPMRASDITAAALSRGIIRATGKTPAATMQAQLSVAAKNGEVFIRTCPGTYGLIDRDQKGQVATGGGVAAPPKPEEPNEDMQEAETDSEKASVSVLKKMFQAD
jgi:hypothetical protein